MNHDNANAFRDRMDKLIREIAPDDIVVWIAAMQIVSDCWIAGYDKGMNVAKEILTPETQR